MHFKLESSKSQHPRDIFLLWTEKIQGNLFLISEKCTSFSAVCQIWCIHMNPFDTTVVSRMPPSKFTHYACKMQFILLMGWCAFSTRPNCHMFPYITDPYLYSMHSFFLLKGVSTCKWTGTQIISDSGKVWLRQTEIFAIWK